MKISRVITLAGVFVLSIALGPSGVYAEDSFKRQNSGYGTSSQKPTPQFLRGVRKQEGHIRKQNEEIDTLLDHLEDTWINRVRASQEPKTVDQDSKRQANPGSQIEEIEVIEVEETQAQETPKVNIQAEPLVMPTEPVTEPASATVGLTTYSGSRIVDEADTMKVRQAVMDKVVNLTIYSDDSLTLTVPLDAIPDSYSLISISLYDPRTYYTGSQIYLSSGHINLKDGTQFTKGLNTEGNYASDIKDGVLTIRFDLKELNGLSGLEAARVWLTPDPEKGTATGLNYWGNDIDEAKNTITQLQSNSPASLPNTLTPDSSSLSSQSVESTSSVSEITTSSISKKFIRKSFVNASSKRIATFDRPEDSGVLSNVSQVYGAFIAKNVGLRDALPLGEFSDYETGFQVPIDVLFALESQNASSVLVNFIDLIAQLTGLDPEMIQELFGQFNHLQEEMYQKYLEEILPYYQELAEALEALGLVVPEFPDPESEETKELYVEWMNRMDELWNQVLRDMGEGSELAKAKTICQRLETTKRDVSFEYQKTAQESIILFLAQLTEEFLTQKTVSIRSQKDEKLTTILINLKS